MENSIYKKRGLKLVVLLLICAALTASLSGCLSSCGMLGGEYFTELMDELFVSMLQGDALSINILISNPSEFGLENTSISLPDPQTDEAAYKQSISSMKNICTTLLSFNYNSLSPTQKCDYDTVMDYFYTQSQYADFYYFQDSYLGSTSGWNVNLPFYLDKYAFVEEYDVNNWISLVEQIYTAFPKYIEFEKRRIDAGYGRADALYEGIAEQATEMATVSEGDEHYLIDAFETKLARCVFLNESQKAEKLDLAKTAINQKLIPAYQNLASEIVKFVRNENNNNQGLYYFENGTEYYKVLFKDHASTDDSIDEAYENLADAYRKGRLRAAQIYSVLAEDGITPEYVADEIDSFESESDFTKTALKGYFDKLKSSYTEDFPALPKSVPDATFIDVPSAMTEFYNPASYFKSAVDSDNAPETIYVNTANAGTNVGFDLIAHEGIPGHLLQHAYFKTSGAHKLRTVLGYTGYAEGWATHAQYYATKYYSDDEIERKIFELYEINDELTLYLITMFDMDVNYYGFTLAQMMQTYNDLGLSEIGIRNTYAYVVENPAVYSSYGYGYYKMNELRKGYAGSDLAFHTSVLSIGPTSYEILEKYL